MALQKNNIATAGLRGRVGNLVYRQQNGKTVVSRPPQMPNVFSKQQKEHQKRFQKAVQYAKAATIAPDTRKLYQAVAVAGNRTSFNVAVSDFFHAPQVVDFDLSGYAGHINNKIYIHISNEIAVKSVHLRIIHTDDTITEEGEALPGTGNQWIYTATQVNSDLSGSRIEVIVRDYPGNMAHEVLKA